MHSHASTQRKKAMHEAIHCDYLYRAIFQAFEFTKSKYDGIVVLCAIKLILAYILIKKGSRNRML